MGFPKELNLLFRYSGIKILLHFRICRFSPRSSNKKLNTHHGENTISKSKAQFNPWNNEVWNGNSESSAICQYVCQSVLFVQPIRSFNLISMLVHCLHMKITTCLLVLINQLRKWDNSFSCELVSSLSAYESCLIYLEQSCHSILSSSMVHFLVWILW